MKINYWKYTDQTFDEFLNVKKITTDGTVAGLNLHNRFLNSGNIQHLRVDGMKINVEEGYGNFSMYNRPPKYLENYIINIELKTGDALLLPKGWWHWVCSDENTTSVNIWNIKAKTKIPKVIKTPFNNKLIDLNKIKLYSWNNIFNEIDDSAAYITLKKYRIYSNNIVNNIWETKELEMNVKKKILKNTNIEEVNKNDSGVNIWHMTKKHCTPLHYDESDNILVVLRGRKKIQLISPKFSEYLFPLQVRPGIPKSVKNNFFMLDRGIRAYGDAFWESPSLVKKKTPPSCTILYSFLKCWSFPKETYSYITCLQYAFGVQNITYACKLDFKKNPYIEFYIFTSESNRKHPYILKEKADLSYAINTIKMIDTFFNISHNGELEKNSDAIYISFELYPEMFYNNKSSDFDAYFSTDIMHNNVYCQIDYYNIEKGFKKGTFVSLPISNTKVKCEFYWKCYKRKKVSTNFYVGTDWIYSKKWLLKNFSKNFVNKISKIKDIDNVLFELCDNIKPNGEKRFALYGIV